MVAYGVMLLATLFFTLLYDNRKKILQNSSAKICTLYQNSVFIFACLPSIFVSAFRFEVGTDFTEVYWVGYLGVVEHPEDPLIARNYVPICQFLNLFSRSPVLFFILSSCLIIFAAFWYIRQTSEKITLPVLLFFIAGLFFDSLNVVRQYMAIAVWLFAYPSMRNRKPVPYLLISTVAILLHPSAFVLLPLYVLYGIRLTRRRFIAAGFVFAAGSMLACWSLPFVLAYIPKYNSYADWKPDPELAGTVFAVLLTAAVFMLYQRLPQKPHTDLCLWSLLLYDSVVFMSFFLPQMGRIMLYFEIPVFVTLIPLVLAALPHAIRRLGAGAVVAFLLCTTLYMNDYLDHSDVFPYHTVFDVENMEDYLGDPVEVLWLFRQDAAEKMNRKSMFEKLMRR